MSEIEAVIRTRTFDLSNGALPIEDSQYGVVLSSRVVEGSREPIATKEARMAGPKKAGKRLPVEDEVRLLASAQRALGLNNSELAKLLDVSTKTMMHSYAMARLSPYGIAVPPLPIPKQEITPRPWQAIELSFVSDLVVHAACKAIDASPRTIVTALTAAVRRARALGLTLEELDIALASPPDAARKERTP
jgi:hypothetical protein